MENEEILCEVCGKEPKTRVMGGKYACDLCEPESLNFFMPVDKVFIRGYGFTTKARIDELNRRVVLPEKKEDGHPHIGRKGENGKIQDRLPTY